MNITQLITNAIGTTSIKYFNKAGINIVTPKHNNGIEYTKLRKFLLLLEYCLKALRDLVPRVGMIGFPLSVEIIITNEKIIIITPNPFIIKSVSIYFSLSILTTV
jgi:hypothetical protein